MNWPIYLYGCCVGWTACWLGQKLQQKWRSRQDFRPGKTAAGRRK